MCGYMQSASLLPLADVKQAPIVGLMLPEQLSAAKVYIPAVPVARFEGDIDGS